MPDTSPLKLDFPCWVKQGLAEKKYYFAEFSKEGEKESLKIKINDWRYMTKKEDDHQLLKEQLEVTEQQAQHCPSSILEIEKLKTAKQDSDERYQTVILEVEKLKIAQRDSDERHKAEIRVMEESHQKKLRQLDETHRLTTSELKNKHRELQSRSDRNENLHAQCQDLKQHVEKLTTDAKEIPKLKSINAALKTELTMMQQSHDTLKKDLEDNQEDLELITKALEIKTEAHELLVENGKLQDTETAITIKKSIADALRKRDFEWQLHLHLIVRLSKIAAQDKHDTYSKQITESLAMVEEVKKKYPSRQHDTNTTVEARWNGILVTNGKLNFEHTINLSKLPTRMNADIRMELGLKFSDLRKISDLLAPEENSDELLLREWLENKYANRDTCCANTNEDSLRSIEMRCA